MFIELTDANTNEKIIVNTEVISSIKPENRSQGRPWCQLIDLKGSSKNVKELYKDILDGLRQSKQLIVMSIDWSRINDTKRTTFMV